MTTSWRRSTRWERRGVVPVSWLALGAAVAVLQVAGGALPLPSLDAPSTWSTWLVGREPVVVAFAVVRLLALVAAWYGLVVAVVGVGLRLVSAEHLASLVDRLTLVPLRRLVSATVAVGLSATTLAATGAGAATTAAAPSVPAPAPVSTTVVGPAAAPPGGPPATVTMHRLDAAGTAPPGTQPPPAGPGRAVETTPGTVAGEVRADTWTVQPGQCFWSIAEAALGRAWGRPPTPPEVVPYWHRLIEANRAELADPHNADLVFPGQVFALPSP